MKKILRKIAQTSLVVSGVFLITTAFLSSKASATVIFSQTFTGANTTLAGTTSTTGGGTWAGTDMLNLNGNTTGVSGAVSLAFTPQNGFIYDLTATINVTDGKGSWLGLGFLNANTTYTFLGSQGEPTALNKGASWENWVGGAENAVGLTSNNVLVRLDTTATQWTAAFFQGGTQMGTTYTYALNSNPTINYVGFVSEGAAVGSVSAFQLTSVPEPSTYEYAMVFGGFVAVYCVRRRRKV